MSMEERLRSAEFRLSYARRTVELVPFLSRPDREHVISWATGSHRRKARKAAQCFAWRLTMIEADDIAKRYAFLAVRRKFDWPVAARDLSAEARVALDMSRGIWMLDVELRQQVEQVLITGEGDPMILRRSVEATAGRLAANLEFHVGRYEDERAWVQRHYDMVCGHLDDLLIVAGAPGAPD